MYSIKNIDPNKRYKIVAGFNKTKLEEFICHDWINSSGELPMLFNKRLVEKIKKICPNDFKENPWAGHLLAFESNIGEMIWHPSLAKELYPSKQFHFLTPEEDSFWRRGGFPNGYNKET